MSAELETTKVAAGFAVGPTNAQLAVTKVMVGFAVRATGAPGGTAERKRAPRVYVRYGDAQDD